jgi:predicted PurR-regulated permease PerM
MSPPPDSNPTDTPAAGKEPRAARIEDSSAPRERRSTTGYRPTRETQVFPRVERRSRALGWRSQDVLRASALIIGLYLLLQLLWVASPLVLTAFLGVLFGLAVEAGTDRLERFRIPRGIGAAGIVILFYATLFGVGAMLAPTIRTQMSELRTRLPQAVDQIEDWIREREDGMLGMLLPGQRAPQPDPQRAGGQTPAEEATEEATQEATSLRERVGFGLEQASGYLFPFLSSTVTVLAGIVLITFLAIYIAADPDTYHAGLMHLFPHRARRRAGEVLTAMATVLRRWLVTQLIAMIVIGVITTIVLLLLDVEAAFALGLIAGLLEFIPTIGPILSAVPAIAMGFIDSPEKALWVTVAYIGIQFLENNLLIPHLMREVDLPPALTIMSQALMAIVFGFLGLMVAVPLVAGLLVPIKMLYVEDIVGDEVSILGEDEEDDDAPEGPP